jgi:O-antigen/teichoic acid export membrane protein
LTERPPTPEDEGIEYSSGRALTGVRWSLLAVLGRQGAQIAAALLIARILGPESYGIISVASIYVILATLLLDQGLSAALVQHASLTARAPGATATLNLLTSLILALLTWLAADFIADFFSVPELKIVLQLLAVALPLKALAVVPRAMLSRHLQFKGAAVADIAGALLGGSAGALSAALGADYYAVVYMTIVGDLVMAVVLLKSAGGPVPNLALREVAPLLKFSASVFGVNGLAYFSRNIDNILVGRFLGVASLSLYGMAYRVLAVPVMLFGQTVNRVMFPVFSRTSKDRALLSGNLLKSMQVLSMIVVPVMVFVACMSSPIVLVVLGREWMDAAPLLSVLAVAGARETIFFIAPSLMRGVGKAGLNLRYEILATALQVSGIVIGLQFGLVWVALGYAAAGFLLTPVLLVIQSRLCGALISEQLKTIWPPVHASIWGAAASLLITSTGFGLEFTTLLGALAYAIVLLVVLLVVHRGRTKVFLTLLRTVLDARRAP